MLRTVTIFKIADTGTRKLLHSANLQAAIPEPTARDPGGFEWSAAGWTQPDVFKEGPVFVGAENTRVLNFQVRERVLPSKVIKQTLARQIEAAERRQGYKPGRKQIAEMKDEVVNALLPTAFIKPSDTTVVLIGDYLLIGAASARMVDRVIAALRSAYQDETLNLHAIAKGRPVEKWMKGLLLDGTTLSGDFNLGKTVALKGDGKGTARFKDMDLERSEIQKHVIEGMWPVQIAVEYGERMHFVMTDQMVLRSIKFSDLVMSREENEEDAAAEFDGTVALVCGEMRQMLDKLTAEMPDTDDEEEEL